MKKDEFFAQLRTAFAGMDEELLTDILGDYENHFKEGIENGKSEEEIFITVFIQAFSVSMLSSQMPILKSKRAIQMR